MAGIFSPSSTPTSAPTAFSQGFSEIGGAVQPVNVNIAGSKVGKHATVQPIINLTDQGAINAAIELSNQSQKSVELLGSRLEAGFAAAIDAVRAAGRSETETLGLAALKWGALVAAAFLAARAFGVLK